VRHLHALIVVLAGLCHGAAMHSQPRLDTLRTDSRAMRLRDGLSRSDWWVEPGQQPDTYNLNFPLAGGTVTFYAERDSLTVHVRPGEHRDFIVRLRDSIDVLTRVSATVTYPRPRIVSGDSLAVQVVPFTIRDNRVYVEGTINGSGPLLMQFDLGAGGLNFNKHHLHKAQSIPWNATDMLQNSEGRNIVPSSRQVTLRIGTLEWTAQTIVQTGNMKGYEDAIFGNSLFRDRVVEIDYDRQQLRIHPHTPPIGEQFVRHPLAFYNSVLPMIEAELLVDGERIRDWYLFDTGHTGTLLVSARQNRDHRLAERLGAWFGFGGRRLFRAKGFRIGDVELPAAMAVVEKKDDVAQGADYGGYLGNAWLRRFNVILDNRQGTLWLAPIRDAQREMAER
jgi:hypothetical protein